MVITEWSKQWLQNDATIKWLIFCCLTTGFVIVSMVIGKWGHEGHHCLLAPSFILSGKPPPENRNRHLLTTIHPKAECLQNVWEDQKNMSWCSYFQCPNLCAIFFPSFWVDLPSGGLTFGRGLWYHNSAFWHPAGLDHSSRFDLSAGDSCSGADAVLPWAHLHPVGEHWALCLLPLVCLVVWCAGWGSNRSLALLETATKRLVCSWANLTPGMVSGWLRRRARARNDNLMSSQITNWNVCRSGWWWWWWFLLLLLLLCFFFFLIIVTVFLKHNVMLETCLGCFMPSWAWWIGLDG